MRRRYRHQGWPARDELIRLVQAAQRCEPRALDELLSVLRPSFIAVFARRMATDSAEDLTQTALIRIGDEIGDIDAGRAGRYVGVVVRSLVQTECQRIERARRRSAPPRLGRAVPSPFDVESEIEYEELVDAVRRAIAVNLPPEMAAVLAGTLAGMNLVEMAAATGSSPLAVRVLLRRARMVFGRAVGWNIDGLEWRTG